VGSIPGYYLSGLPFAVAIPGCEGDDFGFENIQVNCPTPSSGGFKFRGWPKVVNRTTGYERSFVTNIGHAKQFETFDKRTQRVKYAITIREVARFFQPLQGCREDYPLECQ
jgi:hypothetical protein